MSELTDFQASAANIALRRILYGENFYISDFDALAKLIGKEVGGLDYQALRGLHCVKWSEISETMRTQTREKIAELLGIRLAPEFTPEKEVGEPPIEKPRLRLAFWE